ncbi:MAG: GNAT family N-acetyltransferase [Oscillospiraceae bacterium]|jgi:RimJ/RimL family protein N-acetyltransferase|nr:GNAT family N-acetyltransferase [Oscillospiraceae bacterium]
MRIETTRLVLFPMTEQNLKDAELDLSAVARRYGASMPHIGFWEMRAKRRIYRAKTGIILQNPRAWLLSTAWLIVERDSGVAVGEAGFKGPPAARHTVEIGYGVLEDYRCRGYMTEALGALTRFAFFQRDYRVERVTALTLPGNTASHRVLEKNGFARRPSFGKYWLWERLRRPEDTPEGLLFP